MADDLLFEIGCEELPASFVAAGIEALPELVTTKLAELRLEHGPVRAFGTPRRLAVLVEAVAERQADLDQEVLGPPVQVAFDAEGRPTRACLALATRLGCRVEDLVEVETPRGKYLAGRRREAGRPAVELLPRALEQVCAAIPFRKAMRWSDGDTPFGRPVRWLLALLGERPLELGFAGVQARPLSYGHRFLAPQPIALRSPAEYLGALRAHHVLVDPEERRQTMLDRLRQAAAQAGGELIEDQFLVEENLSLVEEPQVVAGGFGEEFLRLPEQVILAVARGHQRYFGVRAADGRLLPKYLAVCNTALVPENIRRGNDRVMRARLADAMFFFHEDCKQPLHTRRPALDGIVFQQRLGSVGDKVRRLLELLERLGPRLGLSAEELAVARRGAELCKCDLVTLMVGELPELEGEMGRVYALESGESEAVANVIREHYQPRTAESPPAPSRPGALVAIADRMDTLVGCFALGLVPTGTADPLGLRRAAIGTLRTLLAHSWDLSLSEAMADAYAGFSGVKLELELEQTQTRLGEFFAQRLRGVLGGELPQDAVDACLAAGSDRPWDAACRARALAQIEPEVRAQCGEVFKRAANIARDAPDGEPVAPAELLSEVHPSEQALVDALGRLRSTLESTRARRDYGAALRAVADFAPLLARYFDHVYVMVDDERVRANRLRLMRQIELVCSELAHFNLLATRQ